MNSFSVAFALCRFSALSLLLLSDHCFGMVQLSPSASAADAGGGQSSPRGPPPAAPKQSQKGEKQQQNDGKRAKCVDQSEMSANQLRKKLNVHKLSWQFFPAGLARPKVRVTSLSKCALPPFPLRRRHPPRVHRRSRRSTAAALQQQRECRQFPGPWRIWHRGIQRRAFEEGKRGGERGTRKVT